MKLTTCDARYFHVAKIPSHMVRSFGLGIPGTRNVYIFVPSIPRCVLLVIPSGNEIFLVI